MFASRTEIGGKSCMFIWCNAAVVVLFENAAQHLWALDQAIPIWEFCFRLSSIVWFYHLLIIYCWSHPTDVISNLMRTISSLLIWLCCRWCTLNRMSLTSQCVLPIVIVSGKHVHAGFVSLSTRQDQRCCFPEQTLPTGSRLHNLSFTVQSCVSLTSFHYRFQSSL